MAKQYWRNAELDPPKHSKEVIVLVQNIPFEHNSDFHIAFDRYMLGEFECNGCGVKAWEEIPKWMKTFPGFLLNNISPTASIGIEADDDSYTSVSVSSSCSHEQPDFEEYPDVKLVDDSSEPTPSEDML